VLAEATIAEAAAAETAVLAMPTGGHTILGQVRQAIERRARALMDQLKETGDEQSVEVRDCA
jgi:hypothetical protein